MVPVPRGRLQDVYRLLAADGAAAVEGPTKDGEWTPEELRRLYEESAPVMRTVLAYLAENAGRPVKATELARAVYGLDDDKGGRKLAGALGAVARRGKNRYGKRSWPFSAARKYQGGGWQYEMDADTAEHILKAAERN